MTASFSRSILFAICSGIVLGCEHEPGEDGGEASLRWPKGEIKVLDDERGGHPIDKSAKSRNVAMPIIEGTTSGA